MKYVKVCEEEDGPSIELPLEEDNTLLLSTLTCQFSKATGLKYKSKDSGIFRGVRFAADRFYSPPEGWDSYIYSCVLLKDNKRKVDDENSNLTKNKKIECKKCTDLIVLNIPWRTDDEALRLYFSKFGEVVMVQVKREPDTMKSKGYAFIRFSEYDAQVMCLAEQHCIDNRWCEVKIPYSKMAAENTELRNKIHVGRLTENITSDVLRSYFNQYGKVESIYIPRPFRSFAFVTFEEEISAQNLLGRELQINDECLVVISAASPKINHANNPKNLNGSSFGQGYGHWNAYEDVRMGHHQQHNNHNNSTMNSNMNSAMLNHQHNNNNPNNHSHHRYKSSGGPNSANTNNNAGGSQSSLSRQQQHHHHHNHNKLAMSSQSPPMHHPHPHHAAHVLTAAPHDWMLASAAAYLHNNTAPPPPAAPHHRSHTGNAAGATGHPSNQGSNATTYHPHPHHPTADINHNTNAMAALNIINNPSVVAAIMSAAAARAAQQDHPLLHHNAVVSSQTGAVAPSANAPSSLPATSFTITTSGKPGAPPTLTHDIITSQQNQQQQQQHQHQQQQFLYSHLPSQNNWSF